jgi:ATP-binding cassette subfamily B protein
VALVGESGEGKTTLTNLLLRLYEPQSGKILIDGHDISEVTQESLRGQIGIVFQEPALFSGTIRENISYARPKASEKEIMAAAKAANAHEFVEKFEKGYETEIGERGLKLSGGQKQRIAIARALLKDAPILILDEATSSLDSRSEHLVQDALERLMKGRTIIIIAHRLSTIANVDQIITLSGGTVDEIGSPSKLAQSGGIYSQLLTLQRGGPPTKRTKQRLQAFELVAK